jgi:hypothetical protein
MTLTANKGRPATNGGPPSVVVRTTYGPITNEVTEDHRHVRSFHTQLGVLLDEIEKEEN